MSRDLRFGVPVPARRVGTIESLPDKVHVGRMNPPTSGIDWRANPDLNLCPDPPNPNTLTVGPGPVLVSLLTCSVTKRHQPHGFSRDVHYPLWAWCEKWPTLAPTEPLAHGRL